MSKQQELFRDEFTSMTTPIVCPSIKKKREALTKAQIEFNRLNKKIASLKQDINQMPEKKQQLQTYYKERLAPILHDCFAATCKICYYWDTQYEKKGLPANELFALSGLIMYKCRRILEEMSKTGGEEEEEDIKAITTLHRKHQMIQSSLTEKQLDKAIVKEMLQTFTFMTGQKPTPQMKKAKTEEEVNRLIEEFFLNQHKEEASNDGNPWEEPQPEPNLFGEEPPRQKRKMSKAELTRKLQEEQTLKSIRTIYMELVKELHPDREQDETLRLVKEERMKQLTEAYQNKDLSALLTMQIIWLEESVKSPEGQSDEILKGYNKILKKELEKLKKEQEMMQFSMSDLPREMGSLLLTPLEKLPGRIEEMFVYEQLQAKDLLKSLKAMSTKRGMTLEIDRYLAETEEPDDFDNEMDEDSFMEELLEALLSGRKSK